MKKISLFLAACCLGIGSVCAQGTVEDYQRAYDVKHLYSANHVYYSDVTACWIGNTHSFWYVRHTPEGNFIQLVNAETKERKPLFDHQQLAGRLKEQTGQNVNANYLYLQNLWVDDAFSQVHFVFNNRRWTYQIAENKLTDNGALPPRGKSRHWMEVDDEKGGGPVTSPDGKYVAYVKEHNVFVREQATGKERQMSCDGTIGNYYSSYISWAPDSRKLVSYKIRPVEKRYVYYVESSPRNQVQPILHKQEYAKPGDELPFKHPCIFHVPTGKVIQPSTELFAQQYALLRPQWNADSKAITFDYNQRGHKVYRVLELSAETGEVRPLIEETHDKYVNYTRYFRHDLGDGKRIIWMSERDNWNHLYMYDRATGQPTHQITKGEWYVRRVLRVDEKNQLIYFSANGVNTKEDPYHIRYYRIGFDGKNMTDLTPHKGMHQAQFSADMKYLVDSYSTAEVAPETVVRNAESGKVVMELEKADISKLVANGWRKPEVFSAKGRDGKTDIWGLIYRPSNFDENKTYPIIEYIYQGPGDQYVPKSFHSYNWNMSSIAELGFVVVMVDGMSTSFRSRAFENVCYQNLKDAGLPDHMAWIKAAAKKYPYMDINRVGIYGSSAGGQESTNALLLYPDFYKAAYSACGCHDNRMDKIWWNELWMGYPVGDAYKQSSNVENAHLLRRPLMLVVGEMDDNVDPASTMQVADALIKANKDFELVVIPGARHTMGESYGEHKRYDFFVKHLLGVTPPAWDKVNRR